MGFWDGVAQGQDAAQKFKDNLRLNAAHDALVKTYGDAAGDPQAWGQVQSIQDNQQLQPGKLEAQTLANQGTAQSNTDTAQAAQNKGIYSLTQLLRGTATLPNGSIDGAKYDQLMNNPVVQKITGLQPDQIQTFKGVLTQPGGAAHLDTIASAALGPDQASGAAIPVQNPDGTYGLVRPTKFGNTQTLSLGGAQPVSAVQGQAKIDVSKERLAVQKAALDQGITLTPEALEGAAHLFAQTGVMPNFGYGKQGAALRTNVANKAFEGGTTGDQVAANAQNYKSAQTYKNDLARSSPTSAGGMARSAGAVFAHIDTLDQMIDALGNKNLRYANYLSQKFKQETGSAIPTTFDAQRTLVGDELTRYLIARGGTLHDREQMQATLDKANSPQQLRQVIATWRDDIGAQLSSQYAQAKGLGADKDFLKILTPEARFVITGVDEPSLSPNVAGRPTGNKAAPSTNAALPKITGDADFAKLPSGAHFIAPDGSMRVKH